MSILKYKNVTTALDGSPLHWGRADIDGLPYKGKPPNTLKEDELTYLLTPSMDVYVKTYDLSDPEQKREYEQVMDRIANGWYVLIRSDLQFDRDNKKWIALVSFGERYVHLSTNPEHLVG